MFTPPQGQSTKSEDSCKHKNTVTYPLLHSVFTLTHPTRKKDPLNKIVRVNVECFLVLAVEKETDYKRLKLGWRVTGQKAVLSMWQLATMSSDNLCDPPAPFPHNSSGGLCFTAGLKSPSLFPFWEVQCQRMYVNAHVISVKYKNMCTVIAVHNVISTIMLDKSLQLFKKWQFITWMMLVIQFCWTIKDSCIFQIIFCFKHI